MKPGSTNGFRRAALMTTLADLLDDNAERMARLETTDNGTEIANSTRFGLTSGVWTRDISRAHRFARSIHAGTVWVNTYRSAAAQAPFGGVKHSGYGRERGWHALQEYTRVKNVMVDLSQSTSDPFSIRSLPPLSGLHRHRSTPSRDRNYSA